MSDVIMFFYQGREAAESGEGFHWSEESWNEMRNLFAGTPGAQVLFLDVTRDERALAGKESLSDPRVGVLHYAWLGASAPADAPRLMTTLEDGMPRSPQLGDLQRFVDSKMEKMEKNYAQFIRYEGLLPEDLKTLVINGKK